MKKIMTIALVLQALGGFSSAFAATQQSNQPTPQTRQKMAQIHEKMARCLRSSRPIQQCRNEMRQGCQRAFNMSSCMQGMGMGNMKNMGNMGGMGAGTGQGMGMGTGAPSGTAQGQPQRKQSDKSQ